MGWVYLAGAIAFELAGTTSMKFSQGFTRLTPSILIFVFYGISFSILTLALKTIDLSVAYAIWSGVGTALIAVIGFIYFSEPLTLIKVTAITLIVVGVVVLQLFNTAH